MPLLSFWRFLPFNAKYIGLAIINRSIWTSIYSFPMKEILIQKDKISLLSYSIIVASHHILPFPFEPMLSDNSCNWEYESAKNARAAT